MMKPPVNALRVLIKAALIFATFNLLFAWLNPPIGKLTAYNWLWPGRVRFPYSESPKYYSQDYNTPLIQDFDAMFGAHILSASPTSSPKGKPADEFRVLLLGDSSTWGGHVTPDDMLASQINRLSLTTCDGRNVKAYNLGYPWPSLLRDVLILDHAMQYQPDMVIWLVTLHSFEKKLADREFLIPHAERMAEVIAEHQLVLPKVYSDQVVAQPTLWDKTIIGQRGKLKSLILNQVYGLMWSATGIDNANGLPKERPPFPQDVEADVSYFDYQSPNDSLALVRSLMFDVVRVGHEVAGDAPLIVVNEPIFIVSGKNSELRYNHVYPRWAYDAYRQSLAEWMSAQGYPFYDVWNALPASEFSNDMAHRDPQGEEVFANLLAPILQGFSCP
jgi:hypothetical protein